MLIVFFGVSGVGKTTIMKILNAKHGWSFVKTYTTRKVRANENEKVNISNDDFETKSDAGLFSTKTHLYGSSYGTLKSETRHAEVDSKIFMLDFPLSNIKMLDNVDYVPVLVQPMNSAQVANQLLTSGRAERIPEMQKSYSLQAADFGNLHSDKKLTVINQPGLPEYAANAVYSHVEALQNHAEQGTRRCEN